jgi:hypothetical protein
MSKRYIPKKKFKQLVKMYDKMHHNKMKQAAKTKQKAN